LQHPLTELPQKREIAAYCLDPNGLWSFEAVARLHTRGFQAQLTAAGSPECKAAGLPVEMVVRWLCVVIHLGGPVHERSR